MQFFIIRNNGTVRADQFSDSIKRQKTKEKFNSFFKIHEMTTWGHPIFLWTTLANLFFPVKNYYCSNIFGLFDKFYLATADGTANGIGSSSGGVCDRHNMKIQIRVSEVTGKWFNRFTGYQFLFCQSVWFW